MMAYGCAWCGCEVEDHHTHDSTGYIVAGGKRMGKKLAPIAAFLDHCETGKRSIYISREYVVIPRAIWDDMNKATARHRILSIDEGRIIEQPPAKEDNMIGTGMFKTTMEVRTLDDERRRELSYALFNQLETVTLEEIAKEHDVAVTPLTDHEGR